MPTERIQIIVTSKGTVTVKKEIDNIGASADKSGSAVSFLQGAIASLVSGQAVQSILSLADAGTQLTNSLKVAGFTGAELADQQSKLFSLAKQNGQDVNELAGVYQKLTSVQGQLGASNDELDQTLINVAASMKLSSASSSAQAGALRQLGQVFGGINVQAEEYNSLIDGAYPLLQAVAAGSDKWRGSVAALTLDVRASKVTSKEFFDALLEGGDANVALAASFNLTIGQALTNFRTNMIQAVLEVQRATGIFSGLAIVIDFFGNHLIAVAAILSPLIIAITTLATTTLAGALVSGLTQAAAAIGTVVTAMGRLALVALANPFTALIAGLVIVIAYFIDWKKAIIDVIDAFGKLLAIAGDAVGNEAWKQAGIDIVASAQTWGEEIAKAADDFAVSAKRAITGGAVTASASLTNGMIEGAREGREILKAGTEEHAQAVYNALNGVPQKIYGAVQAGSDYQYNQITGAVTRSSEVGGNLMKDAIVSGGQTAAGAISSAISSASREATIQMNQAIASQRSALLETAPGLGFIPGGSGPGNSLGFIPGGSNGAGSQDHYSGPRGGNLSAAIQEAMARERENHEGRGETWEGNSAGAVTIVNQLDPNSTLEAINSHQGGRTIVNVIKANASEIGQMLGVV